jgi:hypothetical protein
VWSQRAADRSSFCRQKRLTPSVFDDRKGGPRQGLEPLAKALTATDLERSLVMATDAHSTTAPTTQRRARGQAPRARRNDAARPSTLQERQRATRAAARRPKGYRRTIALRTQLEAAVEAALTALDALDGDGDIEAVSEDEGAQCDDEGVSGQLDPDLEYSLGRSEAVDQTNVELPSDDKEWSLGWGEDIDQRLIGAPRAPGFPFAEQDMEEQCEDEGGACDDEGHDSDTEADLFGDMACSYAQDGDGGEDQSRVRMLGGWWSV